MHTLCGHLASQGGCEAGHLASQGVWQGRLGKYGVRQAG